MRIYLDNSNIFANFEAWIGGSCKPSDKGKLTAFPRFKNCQHKSINVSSMLKFEELPEINSPRWLSLEDLPGEEWRDVVCYEDILQISCYGRLKRKERLSFNSHNNCYCRYKEKIYRNQFTESGYMHLNISIGNTTRVNFVIHRLVAMAFIPNPNNLPFINHKDENPNNDCAYNLEWCTPKYNSNYGTVNERRKRDRIEKGTTIKVVLYDYEGNVLKRYNTIKDAAIDNNMTTGSVYNCCEGRQPTASGLHFRYESDKYVARDFTSYRYRYDVYKNNTYQYSTYNTKGLCRDLNINYGAFRRFNKYDRLKLRGLEDYEIVVHTPKGEKYRIKNNKKVFEL